MNAAGAGLVMLPVFGRGLTRDDQPSGARTEAWPAGNRWAPPTALWILLAIAFIAEILDETISEWLNLYLEEEDA